MGEQPSLGRPGGRLIAGGSASARSVICKSRLRLQEPRECRRELVIGARVAPAAVLRAAAGIPTSIGKVPGGSPGGAGQ